MKKPSRITASIECVLFFQGSELIITIPRKKRVWFRRCSQNDDIKQYLPTECFSPEEITRIETWWASSQTNPDLEYLWEELGPILEGMEAGTRPDWVKLE